MTDSEDSASARVEGCSQEEWERLVDSSCRATFFHTHAWNSFLQDYGEATSLFRPRHIFERDDAGRLVGIFPLYVTPRRDAKSLPCGDYGGPLVEDGEAGRRAMPRLLRRAASIPGLRIWKLVVEGIPGELQAAYEGLGYRVRVAHRTYILDLAGRSLESVESGFRRDARRAFRKAAETSATIRGPDSRPRFILLAWATSMHTRR